MLEDVVTAGDGAGIIVGVDSSANMVCLPESSVVCPFN